MATAKVSSFQVLQRDNFSLHSKTLHTTFSFPAVSRKHCRSRRFITSATASSSSFEASSELQKVPGLKNSLLRTVASLDRGVAASPADIKYVDDLVSQLESAGASMMASADSPIDERSDGNWKLVYTTNIAGSSGALKLGQVFQRISQANQTVDNCVELLTPSLPFFPSKTISATLNHSLTVTGPNTIQITFEKITFDASDVLPALPSLPELPDLPEAIRPPSDLRSGKFDCTFVDDEMRVSRGDRGELRVFVKEN